jgi:hypothetical protein
MISIECSSSIIGEKLIESLLFCNENGVKMNIIDRKGEVIKKGRNKGKIAEKDFIVLDGNFDSVLDYLLLLNKRLTEDIDISITLNIIYESQCNFDITIEQVRKLLEINIPLNITCYKE